MAEVFQTPSLFNNGFTLAPQSLIPEAPQTSSWESLLQTVQNPDQLFRLLLSQLPNDQRDSVLLSVLLGETTQADAIRSLTTQFTQPTQNGVNNTLQGSPPQFGLTTNPNLPTDQPSQYATTTTPLTQPPVTPPQTTPPTSPGNTTRGNTGPLFSFNNPFYSQVTSPVLNEQGQEIGQTNLANNQFATPGMANSLLGYLSSTYGLNNGRVVESQYSGPTRPSQSELGIQFGNSPTINAGLEYQRLQNTNNYSQPYLDAQFRDTLQPGSSGWNNYANTGGQSINSAQAERLYAGNPQTDPNVNQMGQAWKQAEYNAWNPSRPQSTQSNNNGGPSAIGSPTPTWNALTGNLTGSGLARAQNQRQAAYNQPMNFRGMNRA